MTAMRGVIAFTDDNMRVQLALAFGRLRKVANERHDLHLLGGLLLQIALLVEIKKTQCHFTKSAEGGQLCSFNAFVFGKCQKGADYLIARIEDQDPRLGPMGVKYLAFHRRLAPNHIASATPPASAPTPKAARDMERLIACRRGSTKGVSGYICAALPSRIARAITSAR